MFYDYIITQFYPNIFYIEAIIVCIMIGSFAAYNFNRPEGPNKQDQRLEFRNKWSGKLKLFIAVQTIILIALIALPDVDYITYYYSDVRIKTLTQEQVDAIQIEYDKRFEQSKSLLLDCLEKGQKQPNSTTFNDTNEVVKTCYDVAKYKF